jgi:REP-associated tyrosine transposase
MPNNVPSRKTVRLENLDYAFANAHFVTLRSFNQAPVLGGIVKGKMALSVAGHIASACWLWLEQRYPFVVLDAWVVMPNHLHGILILSEDTVSGPPQETPTELYADDPDPVGQLIGAFRAVSTKHLDLLIGTPGKSLWERHFDDHGIGAEQDLIELRRMIAGNPGMWEQDEEFVM